MGQFGVIPFQFGIGVPETIRPDLLSFYTWIVEVTHDDKSTLNAVQQDQPLSLAYAISETGEYDVYKKLLDFVAPWVKGTDVIVVDLLYHYRNRPGRIDFDIATALLNIRLNVDNAVQRVVILVGSIPDESVNLGRIVPNFPPGSCYIISESGRFFGWSGSSGFSEEFQRRYKEVTPEPIRLLQQKLVARRGHFRNDQGTCVKAVFDGSRAERELTDLFFEQFRRGRPLGETVVLYHAVSSSWLENPVRAAALRTQIPAYSYQSDLVAKLPASTLTLVILAVPLFDSGKTTEGILVRLRAEGFAGEFRVIAAISTRGEDHTFGRFSVDEGLRQYEIRYFVKAGSVREEAPCIQCKLGIPVTEWDFQHDQIDTLHFWSMADDWREEPDAQRPANRTAAGYLPDLKKVVDENGAWLAEKLESQIANASSNTSYLSNPVVVVCPDEEGARSLAHYFGALKGFTVVPIPRADLDAMIHDEEYAAFNTADKLWAQIIQRAASRSNIVLLEEFVVTGTTKRLLIRALAKIGKAARFHVAVAAFGMGQSSDADSVQTLVLYSCPVGAAVA